ncbi:MAG: hydrogenase formation protein HypD [Candidatus Neomarinimicrobiota bacterium]
MIKFMDEYRDPALIAEAAAEIKAITPDRPINLMEVCGGHTITIFKYGLKKLLPININLISGPGCPVCVTDPEFIDLAIALARRPNVIITTFGDLMRVPGSSSSLQDEKARGADIRTCYSPIESVEIATTNPDKEVVFLGIGFETTAPTVAAAILQAARRSLPNYSVLSTHKTMPSAMKALLDSGEIALHGFICPGHVTAITGPEIYQFIANEYKIPCVVTGFEPLDMLEAIYLLVKQIAENRAVVENQYRRAVKTGGNPQALAIMAEVFEPVDCIWRGLGNIPASGLRIHEKYRKFDASQKYPIYDLPSKISPGCICGDIMRGVKIPTDCRLFRKVCTPENPTGACMVSAEGTCATYFNYGDGIIN